MHHDLADLIQAAVMRVDRLRLWRRLDSLGVRHDVRSVVGRPVTVHIARDWKALAGERDCGLDGLFPGDGAEPGQRLVEARDCSWHRDGLVPDVIDPAVEHIAVTVRGLADEDALPLVFADA